MDELPFADWRRKARQLLDDHLGGSDVGEESLKAIQAAVKDFHSQEWRLTPATALAFLDIVVPDRRPDEIVFGVYLLTIYKRKLPAETWDELDSWLDDVDHRVVCDQLAINITGRLVLADRTRWKTVQAWTRSDNEWRRRFAIMTACAIYGKRGCKAKDVIRLIDPLMTDSSGHVQNVVAFAIRQVAREDEGLALSHLKRWKGRCPHDLQREAAQRLSASGQATLFKAKSHKA